MCNSLLLEGSFSVADPGPVSALMDSDIDDDWQPSYGTYRFSLNPTWVYLKSENVPV